MRTTKEDIDKRIISELEHNTKIQRDLEGQKEFLDRRITSTVQHMKDIVGA